MIRQGSRWRRPRDGMEWIQRNSVAHVQQSESRARETKSSQRTHTQHRVTHARIQALPSPPATLPTQTDRRGHHQTAKPVVRRSQRFHPTAPNQRNKRSG
eukprot:scaffold268_cov210-Ochromonas_danica.AAC.56